MIVDDPTAVRAAIARVMLSGASARPAEEPPPPLGGITLRAHQVDAVRRLREALTRHGGALLADAVGLGKTYVALALARDAARPLVVAPAALHDMWRRAFDATAVRAALLSFESLSRSPDDLPDLAAAAEATARAPRHDFVIVDEAHHARNPATRRYRALARLTFGARVLLLSATPIHNHAGDLRSLLALFLGARARELADPEIAALVVRRDRTALPDAVAAAAVDRLPAVDPPILLSLPASDAIAELILALPPPVPPSDGADGGALLAHALVRQWASSVAALRAALRRRLAHAHAVRLSIERGVYPSRSELRAWYTDGIDQQLAFAELLAPSPRERERPPSDLDQLRDTLREHVRAVRALLAALVPDEADDARAQTLAEICERHAGQRVVAFASYAETVAALFQRLRRRVRAGALTASGAMVAGGPLSRREALARFAPLGSGTRTPLESERIDLLLTTDLLSEGVDLRDASVVVHLDLPWTPARLEQRVGRAARLGARQRSVVVYAFAPPASAGAVLQLERRLRDKLRVAGRTVGVAGVILPWATLAPEATEGVPEHAESVRRTLAAWRDVGPDALASRRVVRGTRRRPMIGAVRASTPGFLAACVQPVTLPSPPEHASPLLLAALGDGLVATEDPTVIRRAVDLAHGAAPVALPSGAHLAALGAIEEWAARRRALCAAGVDDGVAARARRHVIERIARITRRAPQHCRASLAPLVHAARRAALAPCGVGGEWVLDRLACAELPDDAWLRAVGAFGAATTVRDGSTAAGAELEVVALLLLLADAG